MTDENRSDSDEGADGDENVADRQLLAHRCANGHTTYPAHPRCPRCGEPQTETVDLTDAQGVVLTWTRAEATLPGVREPNTLALVEFEVGTETVRILAGTTEDVQVGDEVAPVYVEQLRDPERSVRAETGQEWDGFRFEPLQM